MKHLFICTLFAYRPADGFADTNILCKLAETDTEALEGLETQNLTNHPDTSTGDGRREWEGHQCYVKQCGDDLVMAAAQAIRDHKDDGGFSLGGVPELLPQDDVRALAPRIINLPSDFSPQPLPPAPMDVPVVSGATEDMRFWGFGL